MSTLTIPKKVWDPRSQNTLIHYASVSGDATLCNRMKAKRTIKGVEYQVLYPAPAGAKINCRACVSGIELVTRLQLATLTAEGLEEVLRTMEKLSNGYRKQ